MLDNKEILDYIAYKLDKFSEDVKEEDLSLLKSLMLNPVSLENEYNPINFNILSKCINIKELTIINTLITENILELISKLNYLETLTFEKCQFDSLEIKNYDLNSLSFINCEIDFFDFINNLSKLESLTIVGDIHLNLSDFNLDKLKHLCLSYTTLKGEFKYYNLEHLFIDDTNIQDINFLLNLPNLKSVGLSQNQFDKDVIEKLQAKNVEIFLDSIIKIGRYSNAND